MAITKRSAELLNDIVNGASSLNSLAEKNRLSKSTLSIYIDSLEKEGFVMTARDRAGLHIRLSERPYARYVNDMIQDYPQVRFPEIISGRNLDVLLAISDSCKSSKTVASMLNIQQRSARERYRKLLDRGIVIRAHGKYCINKDLVSLSHFLASYRNYSDIRGKVLWKFMDESLVKVLEESDVKGHLTGFNRYGDYGVKVWNKDYLYYTGRKDPNIVDVLIHSMFQVEDARTLSLAIVFFLKNRPALQKVRSQAEKYGILAKAEEIIEISERVKAGNFSSEAKHLPNPDHEEIRRQLELYGVNRTCQK